MLKNFLKKDMIIGVSAGIISTLLVMWFIEPITNWLFPKVINILTLINASFSDSIYRKIPYTAATDSNAIILVFSFYTLYFLLIAFVLFFHYLFIVSKKILFNSDDSILKNDIISPKAKKIINAFIKRHFKLLSRLTYILLTWCIITYLFTFEEELYIHGKAAYLSINMEIISPVLSDLDYKQLRANFYSIDSKKDYDDFVNHLEIIANENNITLRKYIY